MSSSFYTVRPFISVSGSAAQKTPNPLFCLFRRLGRHNCTGAVLPRAARARHVPSHATPLRCLRLHQSNAHLVLPHDACQVRAAAHTQRQYFASVGRLVHQRLAIRVLHATLREPSVRFLRHHRRPTLAHRAHTRLHFFLLFRC